MTSFGSNDLEKQGGIDCIFALKLPHNFETSGKRYDAEMAFTTHRMLAN
jgi:hypothetical protein